MTFKEIALKLAQGESIEKKYIQPMHKEIELELRQIKNNCNYVIKQLVKEYPIFND